MRDSISFRPSSDSESTILSTGVRSPFSRSTSSIVLTDVRALTEEHCFALDAASVIDKAVGLNHVGGTYANTRPTEFMCLVLKLLQLQPEREIVLEYLRAEEFKFVISLPLVIFLLQSVADRCRSKQIPESTSGLLRAADV